MANETTDNLAEQRLDTPTVKKADGAAKEAASGMQDLLDKQKKAAEYQKDPTRPPTKVSLDYGKPVIVFDNDKAVKVLSHEDVNSAKDTAKPGDTSNKTSQSPSNEVSDNQGVTSDKAGNKQADAGDTSTEKTKDTPQEKYEAAHDNLKHAAEKNITDPKERARFDSNMEAFEKRAEQQHLSPEEKAETYDQIRRLLETPGDKPVDHSHRVILAEQCMGHAAVPTSIDQGSHETCQTTAVEANMFTKHPSAAIKLVADVATTGEYTAKDGTTIKYVSNPTDKDPNLDERMLKPDDEGRNNPPKDNKRSYASQVFQLTAVNLAYNPPGDFKYVQHIPNHTDKEPNYGEQLLHKDANGKYVQYKENDKPVNKPNLEDDQVVRMGNRLDPENPTIQITHKDNTSLSGKGDPVTLIDSEDGFKSKLKELSEQGKLPVLLRVHDGNDPFHTDSGAGDAGGGGGEHVIRVTGYNPDSGKVEVDNQWGKGADHNTSDKAISAHELYLAMRNPDDKGQIAEEKKDIAEEKQKGELGQAKKDEQELLRREHMNLKTRFDSDAEIDNDFGKKKHTPAEMAKEKQELKEELSEIKEELKKVIAEEQQTDLLSREDKMKMVQEDKNALGELDQIMKSIKKPHSDHK